MTTMPFGDTWEPWMGAGDYFDDDGELHCEECGDTIYPGEDYYKINGDCFCRHCEEAAAMAIFGIEKGSYLVEA